MRVSNLWTPSWCLRSWRSLVSRSAPSSIGSPCSWSRSINSAYNPTVQYASTWSTYPRFHHVKGRADRRRHSALCCISTSTPQRLRRWIYQQWMGERPLTAIELAQKCNQSPSSKNRVPSNALLKLSYLSHPKPKMPPPRKSYQSRDLSPRSNQKN